MNLCVFFLGGSKFHKLIHKWNHRSYIMYSLVSGFSPSLKYFCHAAMFVFISSLFLLLCLVFHYVFLPVSPFTLDILVVSSLERLCIKPLCTFEYKPLCRHILSFFLGGYQEMGSRLYGIVLPYEKLFSKVAVWFYSPTSNESCSFSIIFINILCCKPFKCSHFSGYMYVF